MAQINGETVTRDLHVVLESHRELARPQAFRFEGPNRPSWYLPCSKGVTMITIGDSQLKLGRVQISF